MRPTNADDIELKTTLQQLLLDLRCDAVETDVAPGEHSILLRLHGCHCCFCSVEDIMETSRGEVKLLEKDNRELRDEQGDLRAQLFD